MYPCEKKLSVIFVNPDHFLEIWFVIIRVIAHHQFIPFKHNSMKLQKCCFNFILFLIVYHCWLIIFVKLLLHILWLDSSVGEFQHVLVLNGVWRFSSRIYVLRLSSEMLDQWDFECSGNQWKNWWNTTLNKIFLERRFCIIIIWSAIT